MTTIHKQPLLIQEEQEINMPAGSAVLDIQIQNGQLTMWYLCDITRPIVSTTFRIFGTGIPADVKHFHHIATVQQPPFVWHVFMQNASR